MDTTSQIPSLANTATPVSNPIPPKHNSSNRLLIIVGVLVAVFLLGTGTGAYYLGSQSNNKISKDTNSVEPTEALIANLSPTNTSTKSNSIPSGWSRYTNSKYNIQFDYPNSLYVFKNTNDPDNQERLELTQEDCEHFEGMGCGIMDSFQFEVKTLGDLSYQEWIQANLFKESLIVTPEPGSSGLGYVSEGEYCYNRSKEENVVVAGKNFNSYTFSWDQLGHPGMCIPNRNFNPNHTDFVQSVYVSNDENVFIFTLRYKPNSELEKNLKDVLTTVKFL